MWLKSIQMYNDELKSRLQKYADKLENDSDYEMSEEMQQEYYYLKEELDMLGDLALLEKFEEISEEYDNPESVSDAILKDMYPDTNGEFDLDEWD